MLIKSVHAHNFKSLVDFQVDLPKLTCLIGLNGAGKSTLLQFLDFVARQMRGDMKGWLEERQWQASDLNSRFTSRKNVDFSILLDAGPDAGPVTWTGSFNTTSLRCSSESLVTRDASLDVRDGRLRITQVDTEKATAKPIAQGEIEFEYEGSVLSQLRARLMPTSLREVRDFFAQVSSLDLLAPHYLRQRTREAAGSLGLGGQKLSSFVYEIGPDGRRKLTETLRRAYGNLKAVEASSQQYGWKQLRISERFQDKALETEARHVSDGMLRLIAILAELQSDHPLVLLDEIENGINPELVEFLIGSLTAAPQQVIVTTHSPLILNYLDDEVARSSVLYVYRRPDGPTRCIPFFSIPSLAEKLKVMGPGEVFADTNLLQLAEEISRLPEFP